MTDRLCLHKYQGAMCTKPEGHAGNHTAESAFRGNVIATWPAEASDAGQGQCSPGEPPSDS
jgi:hypothetical protein